MKIIFPCGSDGALLLPLGYNPDCDTEPESWDWFVAAALLENIRELHPERHQLQAKLERAMIRLAYYEALYRGN